ncbi:hypothetical protein KGY77_07305, partial [Candidatus Bipolaricaulota bacterium]|nr:hypothetical protein [Candidatus Bipolaricaulota bacterium]
RLAVSGYGVIEDGDTWIIEDQTDFELLVGKKLSEVHLDGDGIPDVEDGDTILLDGGEGVTEFTQTASITIDRQNITFDGNGNKISQDGDNWTASPKEVDIGYDDSNDTQYTEYTYSSLIIEESGAHIENLTFQADFIEAGEGEFSNHAILVNIEDYCFCEDINRMRFVNLRTDPCTDCESNYDYGIRFVGKVEDWGGRDTSYSEVDFEDVRIGVTALDGIKFENSVRHLRDINFNELYVGGSGVCGPCDLHELQGHGVWFDNYGKLEDITLENSQGVDGQFVQPETGTYGIEDNTDGIRISGETVTQVKNLRIENFDIKGNCDNGINITGDCTAGGDCTPDSNVESAISSIDMLVKNAEITGNGEDYFVGGEDLEGYIPGGFGIFVGATCYGEDSDLDMCYSTAELDKVVLDNVEVFDNSNGGAGFFVSNVSGDTSDPAFQVVDSQFNEDLGAGENDQGFGLTVAAYEGISGVEISNSTFNDHDGGLIDINLPELPDQNLGDGIALLATYTDGAKDSVEDVTIENTIASNNVTELPDEVYDGNGLRIEARTVDNINILETDAFNDNGKDGIKIYGETGVENVTIEGSDDDEPWPIIAKGNVNDGLFVGSGNDDRENDGYIRDLEVSSAQFGEEGHYNSGNGVELLTEESGSDIGSLDSSGAITFDDIYASYNRGHGMKVDSAGSFLNPSENVFINNSEFSYNWKDGLRLVAADDVVNPRIENSTFVGNNINTYGIYISAGKNEGDILGSSGTVELRGNVVANNEKGIVIGGVKDQDSNRVGSIQDFAIEENTTENPYDEEKNGNSVINIALIADELHSVDVRDNRIIGPYDYDPDEDDDGLGLEDGVGLWLRAKNSSSEISVRENLFDSEAAGECVGNGTAILLDAKKTTIQRNEIIKFSTSIKVTQESSGSSTAEDTSNHINQNNIVGCCITIDASELSYEDGKKVDATDNFWGEDYTDAESLAINMVAHPDADDPLDQIFVEPIRDEPVDIVEDDLKINISVTPENPGTNETVELEYELVNTTNSSMKLDEVRLTLIDADGDFIEDDKLLESDVSVTADDSETFTYEFETTNARGEYEAEVSADDYTGSLLFEVGVVEPDEKTPFWGSDADSAQSGILPAPINKGNDETPFLELANEDGDSVHSYVDVNTVRVFDMGGRKVLEITDGFNDMAELEDLENGLYLYTVDYEVSGEDDGQSPVMKFLVRNSG